MKRPKPPPQEEKPSRRILDMEREAPWAGGRFRLTRRPWSPGRSLPLWARVGIWLRWPASVVLSVAAVASAAIACALIAAVVFLAGEAR